MNLAQVPIGVGILLLISIVLRFDALADPVTFNVENTTDLRLRWAVIRVPLVPGVKNSNYRFVSFGTIEPHSKSKIFVIETGPTGIFASSLDFVNSDVTKMGRLATGHWEPVKSGVYHIKIHWFHEDELKINGTVLFSPSTAEIVAQWRDVPERKVDVDHDTCPIHAVKIGVTEARCTPEEEFRLEPAIRKSISLTAVAARNVPGNELGYFNRGYELGAASLPLVNPVLDFWELQGDLGGPESVEESRKKEWAVHLQWGEAGFWQGYANALVEHANSLVK